MAAPTIAELQAAADAAYEAHNAAMGRCLQHPNSDTAWRDVGDTQAAYYRAHAALVAAQHPGHHPARVKIRPSVIDQRIADLQTAHDAAQTAESAAYDTYINLPFGVDDEAAEQAWYKCRDVTKQAHLELLAAIDARREGSCHATSIAPTGVLAISSHGEVGTDAIRDRSRAGHRSRHSDPT